MGICDGFLVFLELKEIGILGDMEGKFFFLVCLLYVCS